MMMPIERTDELDSGAAPVRFWWLKRIVIALVLLLIVLGVHVWRWGVSADRKLQAEIDRCRAAGEPMFPADFDTPPVPKEENAALVYEDAIAAMGGLTAAQTDAIGDALLDPLTVNARLDETRKIIEAIAKTRALVRKARSMPKVDWGIQVSTPGSVIAVGSLLGQQRQLGKTLRLAAIYQHAMGDDAEAVETLLDMLMLARRVDEQPFLISHLTAIAIEPLVWMSVERIAPALVTSESRAATTRPTNRPASTEQIKALIAALLDDSALTRGMVRAIQCERMLCLDMALAMANGRWPGLLITAGMARRPPSDLQRALSKPIRPMIVEDCAWLMAILGRRIEGVQLPTWPGYKAKAGPDPVPATGLKAYARFMSSILLPPMDRSVVLHYRCLAGRRMATVALAIRLHELEHGRRPETLDALVPKYLPAVPRDPLASNAPIRYLPNADPPRLYSVNEDGKDDGGSFALRPSGAVDRNVKDLVFFLNGDRPGRKR